MKIPILFHNFRGYDSHFIIKEIGEYINKYSPNDKITFIANNSEKF